MAKRWYGNLKIGYKLMLGFEAMLGLMAIFGLSVLHRMNALNAANRRISEQILPLTAAAHTLFPALLQEENGAANFLLTHREAALAETAEGRQQQAKALALLDAQDGAFPELKQRIDTEFKPQTQHLEAAFAQSIQQARAEKTAEARRREETAHQQLGELQTQLASLNGELEQQQKQAMETGNAIRAQMLREIAGFLLAACLLAGFLTLRLARNIGRTITAFTQRMESLRGICLNNLQQAVTAMAEGNLTVKVEAGTRPLYGSTQDEFGQMARTFNGMIEQTQATITAFSKAQESLSRLIGQVAEGANVVVQTGAQLLLASEEAEQAANDITLSIQEVAQSAEQSSASSHEIALGSEQQAYSMNGAMGAMETLHDSVLQVKASSEWQQEAALQADLGMQQNAQAMEEVARSAQQMATKAQYAAQVAQTGSKAITATIASMTCIQGQVETSAQRVGELGQKGQEIGSILETIGEIAEQTNLLALNAAIEAARAGEHGRGFSVVADEVRKLAERSAKATREIEGLIAGVLVGVDNAVGAMQASSAEVRTGAAKSAEAGTALSQILLAVQEVAGEVQSVSATTQQMAAGVQAIQSSVGETRRNADANMQSVGAMISEVSEVNASISNVAAISEEAAAGAQEMSATAQQVSTSAQRATLAVQQQSESIECVNRAAQELRSMAAHLQALVQQFELETHEETKPSTAMPRLVLQKAA